MTQEQLDALLAQVARDTTLTGGVVTFLAGLPAETTIAEAIAMLKANNDATEAALAPFIAAPPA